MHIVIICNLFGNNRQGYDLAGVLRARGHSVRLIQYSKESDPAEGNFGTRYTHPHGRFSKFHVLLNLWRIFSRSVAWRKDVVVCIGKPLLPIAALYKILFRSRFVYYSLEYLRYDWLHAAIVSKLVDRYIDVEENRCRQVCKDLSIKIPSVIVYNVPRIAEYVPEGGKLRRYLKECCGATGDEKILVYAGSYQRYAQIENIVKASERFADDVLLVLMVSWGLPDEFQRSISLAHCKIVPPQSGIEFFDWLSDADCSLLPYEDVDFNVQNCSPQKLFDCFLVGVPVLCSRRPIIRNVLSQCPGAGVFCDFTNVDAICEAVPKAIELKNPDCSCRMKALCHERYNYGCYADAVTRFICGSVRRGKK